MSVAERMKQAFGIMKDLTIEKFTPTSGFQSGKSSNGYYVIVLIPTNRIMQ